MGQHVQNRGVHIIVHGRFRQDLVVVNCLKLIVHIYLSFTYGDENRLRQVWEVFVISRRHLMGVAGDGQSPNT